jgi:hypothetical protein
MMEMIHDVIEWVALGIELPQVRGAVAFPRAESCLRPVSFGA